MARLGKPAVIVELGAKGPYVRAVQRIVGVPYTKVDGDCGPFTVALIEAWQARRGVEADGVFGPLSRAAVLRGDFIKPYEGLVLQAYDDAHGSLKDRLLRWEGKTWRRADGALCIGNPTIGWGTRIWPGQELSRQFCTKAQADQWFEVFIQDELTDVVNRYVPRSADPARIAAVYGLGYNGGRGAITKLASTGFDLNYWRAHPVVPGAGLEVRRAEEVALWSAGEG
jgi:GH24 family phage-related lysozyme (muramidase)